MDRKLLVEFVSIRVIEGSQKSNHLVGLNDPEAQVA
jgi:hypothetical protein